MINVIKVSPEHNDLLAHDWQEDVRGLFYRQISMPKGKPKEEWLHCVLAWRLFNEDLYNNQRKKIDHINGDTRDYTNENICVVIKTKSKTRRGHLIPVQGALIEGKGPTSCWAKLLCDDGWRTFTAETVVEAKKKRQSYMDKFGYTFEK